MTTAAIAKDRSTAPTRRVRYWEIDALRGVAIVMMIIFHLMWDFWYYRILPDVVLYAGFWKYFQRTCANLFLILVGVSLAVVTIQRMGDDLQGLPPFRPYLLRGLKIFGCGLLVSLVVWAAGVGYVHFGILHLIGFASVAAYPLLRQRGLNLILWAAFFIAGYFLLGVRLDFPWLLWLGLPPYNYYPNDYFPVIPYFGVVLLGIFLGNSLYGPEGRRFLLPDLSHWLPIRGLQWLGRHSLIIYLLHQIALFAILVALGFIPL
ncbi:MAG: DUF1624 domain-containing protein [Caldilineaceae bacterium]|nr:DUF1624 domain-containing protein [Caldilineaceae bacterium]